MPDSTEKPLRKMTPKQQRFVEEYMVDLNGTQAAIRAGYSAKTANEIGSRLLTNVNVALALQKAMKERQNRTQITADRVLQELARLAFSDLRRAFNEDGSLKLPQEWDDDTAAAMAGVDTQTTSVSAGNEESPLSLTTKKIKVFDKGVALTLAMRHLGMLNDKLEVTMPTVRIKDYTGRN